MLKPLHVVQVGYDDSVFSEGAPSDTLQRQIRYGLELDRQRPGSRMTVAMFTNKTHARRFQRENTVFVPVHGRGKRGLPKLFSCLVALHKERPVDVIATQTIYYDAWTALLFAKPRGIKVIGQAHYDFFTASTWVGAHGRGLITRVRRRIGYRLMRQLFAMRVVSQRNRDRMLAERLHHNVQMIGMPATIPAPTILNGKAESSQPRVLFVGRFVAFKRLADWLKVAARVAAAHPTVQFDLAGDGPLRGGLEALARDLGIAERVHFHGFLSYDKLPSLYSSASVYLITSQSEGLPRVIMEASVQGLPVVGPRIAGVEDIIEDGESGYLHGPGDLEGMAASVLRLLGDEQLRRRMGQTGNEIVRARFSAEKLSREWIALLVSAAGDS